MMLSRLVPTRERGDELCCRIEVDHKEEARRTVIQAICKAHSCYTSFQVFRPSSTVQSQRKKESFRYTVKEGLVPN